MKLKAFSGIMLKLLFVGMLALAFSIQQVKAEPKTHARADYPVQTRASNPITVTLEAIADSYVNSLSPASNYGSEASLKINITAGVTKDYNYTYVMFDLSSVPLDAVISSANLSLYMTTHDADVTFPPYASPAITTHYCSDSSWTEVGITWNNKPTFDSEVTSGLVGWEFLLPNYFNWNVTSDVSRALSDGKLTEVVKWPNYTDPDDYGRANFQSREAAMKPKLVVEYLRVPVAEKYALLLSGGVNSDSNYARYRNDLSFIYTTLLDYYNFREEDITTIYFDGSSQDLDGDGDNDVDYNATEPNVNTAFNTINASLEAEDLFFIFVTDHGIGYNREDASPGTGGFDDILREDLNGFGVDEGDEHGGYGYDEAICLWDSDDDGLEADEVILDDELHTLISGVAGTIICVLEPCFSGGFIDDLSASGRIIMTASLEEETSYGIPHIDDDYDYDSFAYHWTAAVQGSCADANGDKQISMQEAFNYAIDNDEYYTSQEYDSVDTETCQIDDPDGTAATITLGVRTRVALCPIADSHVNSLSPDSNYGSEDRLNASITSGTPRNYNYTYMMFDLTHLPSDAVIQSANLSLFAWSFAYYVPPNPGPEIYVHYCSDSSWTEPGITWNNMPAFDPVATDYVDQPSTGYNSWNVTEDVIGALSNGKLTEVLRWPNYTQPWAYARIEFQSREETYLDSYLIRGYKPKLIVEFLPAPAHLIVRGLNNRIYYRIYNASSGSWESWNVVSTGATCDSPAATICYGRLHLVVRGFSKTNIYGNYSLWHGWINLTDNSFSGWIRLSGSTSSAPTLVCYGSQLILVVRGMNNRIYYRFYDCGLDEWEGWTALASGTTCDSPAAAVLGDGLHIVVRGFSITSVYANRSLWVGSLNLTTDVFSGWTKLSGATESAPTLATSQTLNNLYLVVRGLNDRIYPNTWNGTGWEGWTVLPSGATCDSPTAKILSDELHIVVRGMSGTSLWHYYINLTADDHSGWTRISGSTPSAPTLTS